MKENHYALIFCIKLLGPCKKGQLTGLGLDISQHNFEEMTQLGYIVISSEGYLITQAGFDAWRRHALRINRSFQKGKVN